nr:LepB GTPase-activating domain-containing protein [Legionella tunisiensis]
MTGKQLAKCCLDESEFSSTSLLIGVVLKNQVLWLRMNQALDEGYEAFDQDNAGYEIVRLRQFHQDYILFLTLVRELPLISTFDTKGVVVNRISELFEKLPESLQIELAPTLTKIQVDFNDWQRRRSIELDGVDKLGEESNSSSEMSSTLLPTVMSSTVAAPPIKQVGETVASKLLFFLPAKIVDGSRAVNESFIKKEGIYPSSSCQ